MSGVMKLGYTGTQSGTTDAQMEAMQSLMRILDPKQVHHGDCRGGDEIFHFLAKRQGRRIMLHPPEDDKKRAFCVADAEEEPLPYLERNHVIVDKTDGLIATPKGFVHEVRSGTWFTVRRGWEKANYPVYIIYPDGRVTNRRDIPTGEG